MLAKKTLGHGVILPSLDLKSFTGNALVHSIINHSRELELNPYWWAHIYAANLHEQRWKIEELATRGPVFVTNYYHSFRIWMKAAGITSLEGFFGPLRPPTHTFLLFGAKYHTPGLEYNFSESFLERVERGMLRPGTTSLTRIRVPQYTEAECWRALNETITPTMATLKAKLNIQSLSAELFTSSLLGN